MLYESVSVRASVTENDIVAEALAVPVPAVKDMEWLSMETECCCVNVTVDVLEDVGERADAERSLLSVNE
jgi:isopentenyl diphosphate isomerase/L-lactate dehydrogenase-like FMN-dependent dehydrogenase